MDIQDDPREGFVSKGLKSDSLKMLEHDMLK